VSKLLKEHIDMNRTELRKWWKRRMCILLLDETKKRVLFVVFYKKFNQKFVYNHGSNGHLKNVVSFLRIAGKHFASSFQYISTLHSR
jgi:hypothetical protein